MERRAFLWDGLRAGAALGVTSGVWGAALPSALAGGPSAGLGSTPSSAFSPGPYGSLDGRTPDGHGLVLPEGFTARIVAEGGAPVAGTDLVWPLFPDGKGTVSADDGGWLLVCNHEVFDFQTPNGPRGGASTIGFAPDGSISGAWPVLVGSHSNSRGTVTPWETWLSCQEAFGSAAGDGNGLVWECDPTGGRPAVARLVLGRRTHGSVVVDLDGGHAYLTEAHRDGRLYRVALSDVGDPLSGAGDESDRMEALAVDHDGGVRWLSVPDPAGSFLPTRLQALDGLVTPMGGGIQIHDGVLVFTTGLDNQVHAVDLVAGHHSVVWDGSGGRRPLQGIGDLAVASSGDLFVSEDRGDMEVVMITPTGEVAPFCRMVGNAHRFSAVTGPCFDPSGTRLYVSSLRGRGEALVRDVVPDLDWGTGAEGRHVGVTYEISGPFRSEAVILGGQSTTTVVPASTTGAPSTTAANEDTATSPTVTTTVTASSTTGEPSGKVADGNPVESETTRSPRGDGGLVTPIGLGAALLALGGALALRRRRDRDIDGS